MKKLLTAGGGNVPFIGLGTYPLQGREMADMIRKAYLIGYRLFDTADDYHGEAGIGIAIGEMTNDGTCRREDLFIQTKISADSSYNDEPLTGVFFNKYSKFMHRHSVAEIVNEKVENSLREMKTDYIDSLLIHLPYPGYIEDIWAAMIKLKEEGKVRYIGVSNFHQRHIELIGKTGELPAVNEIYISPIGTKQEQVDYNASKDILLMTYSPLMDLASNRIPVEKLTPMMEKYNKSAAQVILRWNIERGCLPLPKTKNSQRLKENFDIFDFSLTKEETESISSLNYDYQYMPESTLCPGL